MSISTGASPRPTQWRKSGISARTCSGSRQLRWNRIKPSGLASRKNARSSALSVSPAQLKQIANGSVCWGSLDKLAPQPAILERLAEFLRRGLVPNRPDFDAIPDAAIAEIGAHRDRGKFAEQIIILVLDPRPFAARFVGGSQRGKLDAHPAAGRR